MSNKECFHNSINLQLMFFSSLCNMIITTSAMQDKNFYHCLFFHTVYLLI